MTGEPLTADEIRALQYAANGLTEHQAAQRFGTSQRSYRRLMSSARDKLGAVNTTHAVAIIRDQELKQVRQAIYSTRITHIREAHPTRIVVGDCDVCRAFVAQDRAMPVKPDDLDELTRRLTGDTP
jgi:DNA-binding CsgD family transcriptional regulator